MQQQDNLDKITFKVKFLSEYHDIAIDWSDSKYEYKPQQVFEQLESITGILSKYTLTIIRHVTQVVGEWRPADILKNNTIYRNIRNDSFDGISFLDGERFHLVISYVHDRFTINRMAIHYRLIPISEVPEGACSQYVCQHANTEAILNKMRDLVNDDEFNLKFSQRAQTVSSYGTANWRQQIDVIYKEFNVKQYLLIRAVCAFHQRRYNNRQVDLYLRTRG